MVKLTSGNNVNTAPQVVNQALIPQLLIPCESSYQGGSSHHFPDRDAIMARRTVENVRIAEEFKNAISIAERVWIIDKHLFSEDGKNPLHNQRVKKVLDWFFTSQIQTIRILTGNHDEQEKIERDFKALEDILKESRTKIDPPINIELSFSLKNFNYIHDRFAIIDDELWHFGATVGGFHRDVNAASRGWNANTHKAVQFFETVWDITNVNGKKRDEQRMAITTCL